MQDQPAKLDHGLLCALDILSPLSLCCAETADVGCKGCMRDQLIKLTQMGCTIRHRVCRWPCL